jgi:uncharacterized protein (TIGR03435 family)
MIAIARPGRGQNVDTNPKFEVVSIKPSAADTGHTRIAGGPGTRDPERFATEHFSLYYLISSAYDLKHYQIAAPQWTENARFDIVAKIPQGATKAQFRLMLQDMLAERFKLETHWEDRKVAAYDLTVKPSGIKSKCADSQPQDATSKRHTWDGLCNAGEGQRTPGAPRTVVNGNYHLQLVSETMDEFSAQLTNEIWLPVNNLTGLHGAFDIGLTWARQEVRSLQGDATSDAGSPKTVAPEGEIAPTIATAIEEQLGLKLIPGKIQVRVLVVDRVNKAPSDN